MKPCDLHGVVDPCWGEIKLTEDGDFHRMPLCPKCGSVLLSNAEIFQRIEEGAEW
jgi:hypothetical protein